MSDEELIDDMWKSRHPYDVLFLDIISGYEIKTYDSYPNCLFYIKNNNILIHVDNILKQCFINIDLIWIHFYKKLNLEYHNYMIVIKYLLKTHLKLQDYEIYNREILHNINYLI